ncbi:acetylcholine receptor subunit alpha-like 1 [Paramacrobiotus metropolitanus]|uniref:acetylcholine receptor subunit alpha-like 1 n=1 Tax=Paramacrobiotus metropolitanus TaxID=2943436 RepID=UPI002445DD54|nr:acetylcholine receptor subunit alpha-like 1 [Paramacrobiotus metropolitanus]
MVSFFALLTIGICYRISAAGGSESQDNLIKELFLNRNYDALSRPITNENDPVIIHFAVTLNILVFVSDQDQVMKTNGYLDLNWSDPRLAWEPTKYGGVDVLRLPVDKIWQPDIALTNTVDGQFWPNYKSNAVIYSDGTVLWVPPFIYKSGCDTNPFYFPFDHQLCNMVFRSVTYNSLEVDLDSKDKMDLKDYNVQPSGTWEVAKVPLFRTYRAEQRSYGRVPIVSVQLDMTVARKSKFYVTTFLLPCVCIAFLTVFVFYLPTASGEKLCLSISILFSIVIFLLILIDILPPSDSLPLMTKFLLFTFVCNLLSAFLTTISVRWNFRTNQTYIMPRWIKALFLVKLPKYLKLSVPTRLEKRADVVKLQKKPTCSNNLVQRSRSERKQTGLKPAAVPNGHLNQFYLPSVYEEERRKHRILDEIDHITQYLRQFPGYDSALNGVAYIAHCMEEQDEEEDVSNDWKFIALVIDRLLLWIFFLGNAIGSLSILLNSPHLFTALPEK